jgi:hypothetical protein
MTGVDEVEDMTVVVVMTGVVVMTVVEDMTEIKGMENDVRKERRTSQGNA